MSFDGLPQCAKDCLAKAGESINCTLQEVKCICTKDLPPDDGLAFSVCIAGNCPDSLSIAPAMQQVCAQVAGSSASVTSTTPKASSVSSAGSTRTTSSNTPTDSSTDSSTSPTKSSLPSPEKSSTNSSSSSSKLSAGAGAGIGVGVALLVVLLAIGIFILLRRRRRNKSSTLPSEVDGGKGGAEAGGEGKFEMQGNEETHELHGQYAHTPELQGDKTHSVHQYQPLNNSPAANEMPAAVDAVKYPNAYEVHELDSSPQAAQSITYTRAN